MISTNSPEYKKTQNNIKGIFYDFDGTLVDSRQKNYNVTKSIVEIVTGQPPESFPILKTPELYQQALRKSSNWRDFYRNNFKISDDKTDYAGSLWTDYQLRDDTPAPVFKGIPQLLAEFRNIDHAIISQNSRDLIQKILAEDNLQDHFNFIIGYEEVGIRTQKPDPEGLISSMKKISNPISGTYIYIGDHESDVEFTRNTNRHLKDNDIKARVISIAVHYQSESDQHLWRYQPDFQVNSVSELKEIIRQIMVG
jgi:HAD superfamily hydrolase (TIGR01549 family)